MERHEKNYSLQMFQVLMLSCLLSFMVCIVNGYPTGPSTTTISQPTCASTSMATPSTSTGLTSITQLNTNAESPQDPLQLAISEIGFGSNGFLEFDSHTVHENILNPSCMNMPLSNVDFKKYTTVIVKRKHLKQNSKRIMKIQAIIDMSKMSLETNQYLVIHTKEIPNSPVSNVLKESIASNSQSGNTRFPSGKTPENMLDMEDTDVMMVILLYGDVGPLKLQPFNEQVLQSWVPFMVDAVIFGGSHSQKPYNALKILTKSDKRKMKYRQDMTNLYSLSKCSVSYAPFNSDSFRDTNMTPGELEFTKYYQNTLL